MRWPNLFRSTALDGAGVEGFEEEVTGAPGVEAVIEAQEVQELGALELDDVVLVDVRVSEAGAWLGESKGGCGGGFLEDVLEVCTTILEFLNMSGNCVTR
jgi:hypothetical protein